MGTVEATTSFQIQKGTPPLFPLLCIGISYNFALLLFLLDAWPEIHEELASGLLLIAKSQGRFGLVAL